MTPRARKSCICNCLRASADAETIRQLREQLDKRCDSLLCPFEERAKAAESTCQTLADLLREARGWLPMDRAHALKAKIADALPPPRQYPPPAPSPSQEPTP